MESFKVFAIAVFAACITVTAAAAAAGSDNEEFTHPASRIASLSSLLAGGQNLFRDTRPDRAVDCRCHPAQQLSLSGEIELLNSLLLSYGYPSHLIDRLLLAAAVTNASHCQPVSRFDSGGDDVTGEAKSASGVEVGTQRLYIGCAGRGRDGRVKIQVFNATVQCKLREFDEPAESDDPLSLALSKVGRREAALCLSGHPQLRPLAGRVRRAAGAAEGLGESGQLRRGVRGFLAKFAWLKRLVEQAETAEPIRRVTARGFERFEQRATMQAIDGVSPSHYKEFVEYFLDTVEADAEVKSALRSNVFNLVPMIGQSDWNDFRMVFNAGDGGSTKYVNLLARNGGPDGFDFVIANFHTKFALAPNIIVVEKSSSSMWGAFGSSETVIHRVPASIKDSDIEVLMTFFDLAAFRRFAKMLEVPLTRRHRRMAAIGWIGAISAGIDLYSKFASAFSTKKTSKIVGKIVGKGFDHFSMRSKVHLISSMHPKYLDRYLTAMPILYDLPRKYMPKFKIVLEMVRYVGAQDWNKNDFLFDVGSGGRNAWVTILSNRNTDGTYNFLIANVQQTFKLAPNMLIIKESKSVAGGIYQSEKYTFKRIPRSITEADIQMLTNFFNIITFKRFGLKFNVDTSKLDQ